MQPCFRVAETAGTPEIALNVGHYGGSVNGSQGILQEESLNAYLRVTRP